MSRYRDEYIYTDDDEPQIPLPGMPIARSDGGIDVYQADGSHGTYPDRAAYDRSRAEAYLAGKFGKSLNDPRVGGDAGYRDAYRRRFGREPAGAEGMAIPYSTPKNGLESFIDGARDDWRRGRVGPLTKSDVMGLAELQYPEITRAIIRPDEAYAYGANRPAQRPAGAPSGRYYPSVGGKPYKPQSNIFSAFRSGVLASGYDELSGAGAALANMARAPFSDEVDFDPKAAYRLGRDFIRDEYAETRKQHPILAPITELAGALVPVGLPLRGARLAVQGGRALPVIGSAVARYARPIETAIASAIPAFNRGEGFRDSVKRGVTAALGGTILQKALRPVTVLAKRNLPKPVIDQWVGLDRMTKRYGISPLPKAPTRGEIRQQIDDKIGTASRFVGGQIAKLHGKPNAASGPEATGRNIGSVLGTVFPAGSLAGSWLGGEIGRYLGEHGEPKKRR